MSTHVQKTVGYTPGASAQLPVATALRWRDSLFCFTGDGQVVDAGRVPSLRDTSKTARTYARRIGVSPAEIATINGINVLDCRDALDHLGYSLPLGPFSGRTEGMTVGFVGTMPNTGRYVFGISVGTATPMLELVQGSNVSIWRGRRHLPGETVTTCQVSATNGTLHALRMTVDYVTGDLKIKNLISGTEVTSASPLPGSGSPVYTDGRHRAVLFDRGGNSLVDFTNSYQGYCSDFIVMDGVLTDTPLQQFEDYLIGRRTILAGS